MTKQQVLLARQPIYDANLDVWAYELLFRASTDNHALFSNGDMASSQVMLNAFGEAGLEQVSGNKLCFVNLTRNHLISLPPFNPKKFAIEVLEHIELDTNVRHAIAQARKAGYTLALDDQIISHLNVEDIPDFDIIKFDITDSNFQPNQHKIAALKKRNFKLLAERVETYEQFENCKEAGFELFQGYFLAKPQIVKGQRKSENKTVVFDLIRGLSNPDIQMNEVEKVLSKDPQLCYKLLKLVNTAAFATASKANSITQAIVLLGLEKIKSWANLVALGDLEDKPPSLRLTSMIRANMCRMLGQLVEKGQQDSYFTLGLFSLMDAFMDIPLAKLMEQLQFSDEFNEAILHYRGKKGLILKCAMEHERGQWGDLDWQALHKLGLSPNIIDDCYIESIHWAESNIGML